MNVRAAFALSALLPFASVSAQMCGMGEVLLKNDMLPDVPAGPQTVAIVPGLCQNEAAMAIFQVGGPATLYAVSVLFANSIGTNGIQAVVDVEIYDGITSLPGGRWQLGPQVFRLSNSGSNLQIATTGINTFQLPTPVRVNSGTPVVGFRMVLNSGTGSCALGYTSNFATDFGPVCTPGRNVIDTLQFGPIDPATFLGFGVPMCPLFFRGDWVIRACAVPDLNVDWIGNPTPGGLIQLQLNGLGHGGEQYVVLASNGINQGVVTPWGRLPLNADWMFDCFLGSCRPLLLNGEGNLSMMGSGFAALSIPNLASLVGSGLRIHVGFVTSAPGTFFPWTGISAPSAPIVIN